MISPPSFRVSPSPRPAKTDSEYTQSLNDWCRDYNFALREVEKYLSSLPASVSAESSTLDDVEGPAGPVGPQGPIGPQGEPGNDASDGKNALNGIVGPPGEDGTLWYYTTTGIGLGLRAVDWAYFYDIGAVYSIGSGLVFIKGDDGTNAPVSLCLRKVGTQTSFLPSGQFGDIPFSQSLVQVNGDYSYTLNPNYIRLPYTGAYRVGCHAYGVASSSMYYKELSVWLYQGTGRKVAVDGARPTTGQLSGEFAQTCSCIIYAAAGSYLRARFFHLNQDTGASGMTFDTDISRFWAVYLGA